MFKIQFQTVQFKTKRCYKIETSVIKAYNASEIENVELFPETANVPVDRTQVQAIPHNWACHRKAVPSDCYLREALRPSPIAVHE